MSRAGATDPPFPAFQLGHVPVGHVSLRVRWGGAGPPLLLLHGHPRTHMTWSRVAPVLAAHHTVVCPDLRGYGGSSKPAPTPGAYAKREMARDCLELMRILGHRRFAVVGHDRGGYVAFRLAMDHPDVVTRLVVLDGVPIGEALRRCDAKFAALWWHWFFLGNPDARAEEVISADPVAWYSRHGKLASMDARAREDLLASVRDPKAVIAMCEDYRAGLTEDREHDEEDLRRGRRVRCPVLVVWAAHDDLWDLYGDPSVAWSTWAHDVTATSLPTGHHMAEEAPEALVDVLLPFTGGRAQPSEPRRPPGWSPT